MNRARTHLLILGCSIVCLSQGCSGSSEMPSIEATSGAEAEPGEAPGRSPAEGMIDATTQSPWGATQAEQCVRPPRTPMDARAQKEFERGLAALRDGQVDVAKELFDKAVDRDSNAYPALYNLGVLSDRGGNDREAAEYYRRALAVLPDYEPAARGIVAIELRRGNVQGAVAVVEPIARDYRTNLEIQSLYAEVLVEARRYDEAWLAARRALRCDEKFVPALLALTKASRAQGRDELADSILEQALAIDPTVAELHFLNGMRLEDEPGRLSDVLREYEEAVRLDPEYADAQMALGLELLAGGNYTRALTHFQAAQTLIPEVPAVHVNLGDAYRATEAWSESQLAYRQALALQPKLPEAHFGLGLLYMTAGADFPDLDEIQALQKATEEFQTYRNEMGPRLRRDDPSEQYLRDLDRMIQRTRRRMERDAERAAREAAERAAEPPAEGSATE